MRSDHKKPTPVTEHAPELLIKELSFSYEDEDILSHVSLTLTVGRPYLLIGESGRGKTTLLHLIAGLLNPTNGEILGGGIGRVSLAFQDPRLFPTLTALENAAITSDREHAYALLTRLGFHKEDMEKTPDALSGGMQQRVSLARAFLADTPLLLLDEPARGLDPMLQDILRDMIKEEAARRIVLAVSHDVEDIARWDAAIISL